MPAVGAVIELNLQLFDGDTGKFVHAHVKDGAGVDVAGSPFALTHVGNGLYSDDSFAMPAGTTQVTATYIVYNDAGFTIESGTHSRAIDVYNLQPDQCISEIKTNVNSLVSGAVGGCSIEGEIAEDCSFEVITC